MKEKINWEEFSKEAAKLIREGKPLTGKDGILSPLIKQVVESALEGEMDDHIEQTRQKEGNRRNGHIAGLSQPAMCHLGTFRRKAKIQLFRYQMSRWRVTPEPIL